MDAQQPEPSDSAAAQQRSSHLPYLPGLDGVRAIAVLAVLLYHAGLNIYGGFLGVESFFVLSGFLITSLLLLDWQAHGRIGLRSFWWRRARRLLPALFVALAGTLLLAALLLPEELPALGRDTLAAAAYVTNWHLIASGQSYFDAVERPPLLQHLWSLAIEEQFYVLWPLVCAAGLRLLRQRGFLALTLAAAAASTALTAALFDPGADPSRIYYGTDTRAAGLLIGAALALALPPGRTSRLTSRRAGVALDVTGLVALALLLVLYVVLHEQHALLYRGGLTLVSLATALVIAGATAPAARALPWLLERPALRWVGVRSYGIYLWHWPIFMVTRPGVDLPYDGWPIQVLRFALAFALAALSYALVERPIRRGALEHVARRFRAARAAGSGPLAALAATARPDLVLPPNEHEPAPAPQPARRRWAPLFATALSALGVLCVVAGAAQGVLGGQPSAGAVPEVLAAAPAPTAARSPADPATLPTTPAPESPAATASPAGLPAEPSDRPAPTGARPEFDPALAAELQQLLDAAVQDGAIPGAVLSVQLADGTSWTGASGLADPEAGAAMAPETRVRVGSLSKMLTAVVVLQLAQEGQISLDAPVEEWLPDVVPGGDVITVRDLLQHTSGLYDYLEDRRFVARAYQDPARSWAPEELVEYAAQFPPTFRPGTADAWDYSNTNYVLLGMIVERATGHSLSEEIHDRIITPLDLQGTYVVPQDAVDGPQARGFSKADDQTDVAMSFTFGSANIVTTVEDLRRFGEALFGGRLLDPPTRDLMEQFVSGKGQYDMPDLEYGLGLMSNRLPVGAAEGDRPRAPEDGRVLGHIGGFGGFRAALWYAPESRALLALSVNQASVDPNILATQVLDTILRRQSG